VRELLSNSDSFDCVNPIRAGLPVDFRKNAKGVVREEYNTTEKGDGQYGQGEPGRPHFAGIRERRLACGLSFAGGLQLVDGPKPVGDGVEHVRQDLAEDSADDEAATPDSF